MPVGNARLSWYRTDTGADVGESFTPVNGVTYVSAPMDRHHESGVGEWSFQWKSTASTAGTLTIETSDTPHKVAAVNGGASGAWLGANWDDLATTGPTIPAISGAMQFSLRTKQAGKRARLKFVATASAGSVLADGSVF